MEDDAGRGVGLDLVQTKLIETIKVTKTLKPDMDADALGGAVDFQLKKAGEVPELELQVLGGFNDQESVVEEYGEDIFGASGIAGGRFGDERFGLLVGGSYFNTDRGSLFNSWRYANDTGSLLRRHRTTDYDINRERYGFIGNFLSAILTSGQAKTHSLSCCSIITPISMMKSVAKPVFCWKIMRKSGVSGTGMKNST